MSLRVFVRGNVSGFDFESKPREMPRRSARPAFASARFLLTDRYAVARSRYRTCAPETARFVPEANPHER